MELMYERQFYALSEAEKYAVYKDLAFQHYVASRYDWNNLLGYARDFGHDYLAKKLIETKECATDDNNK